MLKYQRIQKLVAGGEKFAEANKQAQEELFAAFGLSDYAEVDASSYSITEGTDESAALIAISSMLLADRSEAELRNIYRNCQVNLVQKESLLLLPSRK